MADKETAVVTRSGAPVQSGWRKVLSFFVENNTLAIFIVLVIMSSFISDAFFSEKNIFNLLRQISGIGIISMGMLLVILTGGIDLSVGSVMALGSVMSAIFLLTMPFPLAVLLTIMIGVVMGCFSGYLVSRRSMAPFIATLALMTIARGLTYMVSKGSPIIVENKILDLFGSGYLFGVPLPVILMFIIFLIVFFLLKYTVFGRMVTAIGSNEAAVRLSGIRVGYYKFMVYAIAGGFSAIAGIISTSRTNVGSPLVGVGLELDAIAAVVIGGASLNGGKGTALNTLLGVLILGMIGNIMNLLNVAAYPQQIIKGLIIVFAVMFQRSQAKNK